MGGTNQNKLTYMYFDNGLDHCLCVSAFQLAVFQLTAVHEKRSKTFKVHFLQSKNGNRWITEPNVSHPCKLDNYGLFSSFIEKRLCTKRFALSLCRALSFTWPAAIVIYQNTEKRNVFIKKKKKKVCWDINMVAVVLFLNTIMAEVTSCKHRYIGFEMVVD